MFARARHNPEPPRPRMRRQFAPLDLVGIFAVDLAHPALVGRDVRIARRRVLLHAIDKYDGIVGQAAGVTENRSSRERRTQAPDVLLGIINLHIIDWPALGPATDQIDVAVMIQSD